MRRALWSTLVALSLGLGVSTGCAATTQTHTFGTAATDSALERAVPATEDRCTTQLRVELARGESGEGCDKPRARAARRLAARAPDARFGIVEQRRVDLRRVQLGLAEARHCWAWPLREPDELVLAGKAARQARCTMRPYRGPLTVVGVAADGSRHPVFALQVRDGRIDLRWGDLENLLRSHGHADGLAAFPRLELGTQGWGGVIHLDRLRAFAADWHADWVVRGRGVPALFLAAHPEHRDAGRVKALSVESALSRQERDYLKVARGELSPADFLARYVYSPYRESVRSFALEGSPSEE